MYCECSLKVPVPSAGTLSPPVAPSTELSDAWFNADVMFSKRLPGKYSPNDKWRKQIFRS